MNPEAEKAEIWELRRGSDVLAIIEVHDQDFPWKHGRLLPSEAFSAVRHYFDVKPDRDTMRAVREQLRQQQIVLAPRDGAPVREFTLIVDKDEARFRFI